MRKLFASNMIKNIAKNTNVFSFDISKKYNKHFLKKV